MRSLSLPNILILSFTRYKLLSVAKLRNSKMARIKHHKLQIKNKLRNTIPALNFNTVNFYSFEVTVCLAVLFAHMCYWHVISTFKRCAPMTSTLNFMKLNSDGKLFLHFGHIFQCSTPLCDVRFLYFHKKVKYVTLNEVWNLNKVRKMKYYLTVG